MTIRLATPNDIDSAIAQFREAQRLCIDTEFHAERRYYPRLFLVQVHVEGGDTWLIDAMEPELLQRAGPSLRQTPWLVHAGRHDVQILARSLGGVPDDILDVQIGAGLVGSRYPQSYGKLVLEYLQLEIDKSYTLSDWSRRPLTPKQVQYAAADVQLLPALWSAIRTRLEARERVEICRVACRGAIQQHLDPMHEGRQWRKLHAVGVLDGRSLSALQALSCWREEKGQRSDQPTRSVLSDGLMVELSKRLPDSIDVLRSNRRFPKGVVKRHGSEIIDTIGRAIARPEADWPRAVRHLSPQSRELSWLQTFALTEGAALGFAASLVLPQSVLAPLTLDRPSTRQALGERLGDWRDALIGDRLWDALQGRVGLRLDRSDVVADRRS